MTETAQTADLETDPNKEHSIADLNQLYVDGDNCDQQIFSEMRSNLLLVAGEHYQRRQSYFYKRIRDSRELSHEQKMRLTKNHTQKISKAYANNITSLNPDVGFEPKVENDLHQEKVAELNHAIWRDGFDKYGIDDLSDDWVDQMIQTGEVITKIFYDPAKGTVTGYNQKVHPDDHEDENLAGQPALDEVGQPVPDLKSPMMSGAFVFEEVFAFNLLRPSECKDIKQAEWLCVRKMVNKGDLMSQFKDPDLQKFIVPAADETFIIFDGALGGYKKTKNQVMVREYYFRPSFKYPRGQYFITTKEGILAQGDLPGDVFPIVIQPIDKVLTTPRGRSPIRMIRPYQAEINRSASKIAEHQVTLGDDKILIQNGTKVSSGVALPGVRSINFTGMAPVVLAGRDGSQYLNYMLAQIKELYEVMGVAEDMEQIPGQLDPYTLLFRSARQKKKFQRYVKRYEKFLINVVKTYLRLAKFHLSDQELVQAIGKLEQCNIPELRNSGDIDFDIKVESQSGDIETKLGKQLAFNHILQYVGGQLKPADIGKIYRKMPYGDNDGCFDDLTVDYDSATNEILALDRGERPPVFPNDNHQYLAQMLTSRTKKPDFKILPNQVQQNYFQKIQVHQQINTQQLQEIQRAEQGFIPTSGLLVPCDFYVQDPSDPTGVKTRRARFPYDALNWLLQQLGNQGTMMEGFKAMPQSEQAQYASLMGGGGQPPGASPSPSSPSGGGMQPGMGRGMPGQGGMPPRPGMPGMPPGMGRPMGMPPRGPMLPPAGRPMGPPQGMRPPLPGNGVGAPPMMR